MNMPKKREINISLNSKEIALAHYEMEFGKNESIKKHARILYYANQGSTTITEFCQNVLCDYRTVLRILNLYETEGINVIYHCKRGKRINHLDQISDKLEKFFEENPPTDVSDAVRLIKENFDVSITATPVRYWLKKRDILTKNQKVFRQKQT